MSAQDTTPSGTAWTEMWVITTRSGSRYFVGLDDAGAWWMRGRNVPNLGSCAMPPQFWQIDPPRPWPPQLGAPLVLMALSDLEFEDSLRVPGGGKITSAVSSVSHVAPARAYSEELSVPTGPADVGLEMIVLPTAVVGEATDAGRRTCWVTAPTCRYGSATYQPQTRFRLDGSILEIGGEERIAGGTCAQVLLEAEYPLRRVDLWRTSLAFDGRALSRLTPAELAGVLAHPWRSIREAAFLALGQ